MRGWIEKAREFWQDAKGMTSLEYGLLAAMLSGLFMFGIPAILSAIGLLP